MNKGLRTLFYLGIFGASFVLFVYWMFPTESLKGRIIAGMEGALGSSYHVEIGRTDLYFLTGVVLKKISIQENIDGKILTVWEADKIKARAGIFSLILGAPRVNFDIRSQGGSIRGETHRTEDGWPVALIFRNLDLSQFPAIARKTGLKFSSEVDGKVNLQYNPKQPLKMIGDLALTIDKLSLKKSEVNLGEMGGFPLPDLNLAGGDSSIRGNVGKGAITLEPLKLQGDDFLLELKGKIFLAPQVMQFRMNLQGRFRFSQKIWTVLDPILPEPFIIKLKEQKQPDNTYPVSLDGPLASPQIYSGPVKIYPFQPF